jgi:dienelactone hydrolase
MTARTSDAVEVIDLWTGGPPSPIEGVGPEVAYLVSGGVAADTTFLRNISVPTVSVFPPPEGRNSGIGVVVVPGGGWTINAISHEGYAVAQWLAAAGHTAFLLKYRVMATDPDQAKFEARMGRSDRGLAGSLPAAKAPRAIGKVIDTREYHQARAAAAEDGQRALEVVQEAASRYSVRPDAIGMIGFSAGAFLAVDVALKPESADELAFLAAIYGGETRGTPVPAGAPPLFALVAQDDRLLFKIVEGLHADWSDADRSSEPHVFARGGHGFGMVPQGLPVDGWTDRFLDWLGQLGIGSG